MPVVQSHGRPYAEPERPDELSEGIPRPPIAVDRSSAEQGFNRRSTLDRNKQSAGGKATKGTTRLSHRISEKALPETYQKQARALRRTLVSQMARDVGGGQVGVMGAMLLKFAAVAAAEAEYLADKGEHDKAAQRRAESRMHAVYARELIAKDAAARPRENDVDRLRRMLESVELPPDGN